jgi:hypothetical protein
MKKVNYERYSPDSRLADANEFCARSQAYKKTPGKETLFEKKVTTW